MNKKQKFNRVTQLGEIILAASFWLICLHVNAQDRIVRLYAGPAPGSENWKQSEQENRSNRWNVRLLFNVVNPTLTLFQPKPGAANGTAVIICPGGGFVALSIDSEGYDVARRLTEKGVTCFVLKYRLVECKTNDPTTVNISGPWNTVVAPAVKLALADANVAVGYVRKHAPMYNLNPDHIGLIGFSAGGTVAASASLNFTTATRPDFTALIYPNYGRAIKGNGVPTNAPPLFVLAASDDHLGLAPDSMKVYQDWITAGKSAELHLYSQGGHGFGMRPQHLPCDHWIERFVDWLQVQGRL